VLQGLQMRCYTSVLRLLLLLQLLVLLLLHAVAALP
jgi:hypothetical protein